MTTTRHKSPLPEGLYDKAPASLDDALRYLRLDGIAACWRDAVRDAAKSETPHEPFLHDLVLEEARRWWQKTVESRVRLARFPRVDTLDAFDFAHPKKINRSLVMSWADLGFVTRHDNLVFLGPAGVGKTHLAIALAHRACMAGVATRFVEAVDLVQELRAAHKRGVFAQKLKVFLRPRLLVIDELGYLPIDKSGADILFQVISKRHEKGSTIVTSNIAFKHWDQIFGNATTASGVLDRLLHHAEVLTIQGDSYRLKQRKERQRRPEG